MNLCLDLRAWPREPNLLQVAVFWLALCQFGVPVRADETAAAPGLLKAGEWAKARAVLEARVETDPKDAEARWFLGRIAYFQNKPDTALRWFEEAVQLEPGNARFHHALGRASGRLADRHRNLSVFGLVRKTRASFEKAVELDPHYLRARLDLARFYAEAPVFLGGNQQLALAQVEAIRKQDPYLGKIAAGDVFRARDDLPQAFDSFEAAVKLNRDRTEAHYRLGELYLELEQYDKARPYFERLTGWNPPEAEGFYLLGVTGAKSGRQLPRAREALKRYLTMPPDLDLPPHAQAHYWLGQIAEQQGAPKEAKAHYQRALQLDPEHVEARTALKDLPAVE